MKEIELLRRLIAVPSPSRAEEGTASIIFDYLKAEGASPEREGNNVWAFAAPYAPERPTLLLNTHHDTVRPAGSYTRDPYEPTLEDGRLYGLGSNDAGASIAALTAAFLGLRGETLPFNLLLAVTAEEEVGGEGGMRAFLPAMEGRGVSIDCAIVGEPTGMRGAVAERGLVVLDCVTPGVSGHAARGEGINAITRAIADIEALTAAPAPYRSSVLGPVGINVTQIQAGTQHNVIPDECRWVADIRTTDDYTNEETVELLRSRVKWSVLTPRSTRVRASVISPAHPLVRAAAGLGIETFISPTTSDMSLMLSIPSLKIGPGDSARSHRADEYVELSEIRDAVPLYISLIKAFAANHKS